MSSGDAIRIRAFAPAGYESTLAEMREFTATRGPGTADEIWLVEHPPVFTLGLAARAAHVHDTGDVPVVATERGGQVTYHGPGQVVAYLLLDLHRRGLGIRELVTRIEQAVIECVGARSVDAVRKPGAPGVYVRAADGSPGAKIASLGIKVSRGCTYHGVALNVAMDLEPFTRIDPCGYPGQQVTDLRSLGVDADPRLVAEEFARSLVRAIEGK